MGRELPRPCRYAVTVIRMVNVAPPAVATMVCTPTDAAARYAYLIVKVPLEAD
jgi:hypothetical protein